jgi:hypothetical protein
MWGALLLMCVACIIPSVFQAASSTDFDIEKVHRDINTYYDALMPAPVLPETGYMPHRRMQGIHSKRCSHTEPGQAILRYKEGAYGRFAQGRQLLVVSSCLYSESLVSVSFDKHFNHRRLTLTTNTNNNTNHQHELPTLTLGQLAEQLL